MSRARIKIGKGEFIGDPQSTDAVVIKTGDGHLIVHSPEAARCELCGKVDELRPYGPKGEFICFECGMKNHKTTRKMFRKQFKT